MRFETLPNTVVLTALVGILAGFGPAAEPSQGQDSKTPSDSEVLLQVWLDDFDQAASKLVALAEEIPAEEYGWRPAPGVRSVAEVYTHVMGTNLFLAGALGSEPPDEMPGSLSSIDKKSEVLQYLRLSLDHVRQAVQKTGGRNLGRPVELGRSRDATAGRVMFLVTGHAHEHLGQLIAYARSRDVTPPWSGGDRG